MTIPESCEELLGQMVAIDTVNPGFGGRAGGQAELAAYLETVARHWGLETRRYSVDADHFNLAITCERVPGGEWLLCESHLDTVSAAGMTVPAWELTVEGDRLYGRGACDTKSSGAAMLWALRDYARAARGRLNVGVVFSVDEECGMTGAAAFVNHGLAAWPGPIRGMLVGEPTLMAPVVAHNGVVRWTTITRGVAAHSSDPSRGRSAISAMVKVITALENDYLPTTHRSHPLTGAAASSINVIRGGTQVNIIPDYCEIEVDRRLVPGETVEETFAVRDAVLDALRARHPDLVVENASEKALAPLDDRGSRDFLAWLGPILAEQGVDPTPQGVRFATDGSHYAHAGVPVIVIGPGDIAQAHTKDEWLARSQLELAVRCYRAAMETV